MTEAQRIAAYESAIATLWQADAAHDMGHLRRAFELFEQKIDQKINRLTNKNVDTIQ